MGKAVRNSITGKLDVCGTRRIAKVVVDVVAGMPRDGLRLFAIARSLQVRLARCVAAGRAATASGCLQPVYAGAAWTPEPTSSGTRALRWHERLGRSRSALGSGRS